MNRHPAEDKTIRSWPLCGAILLWLIFGHAATAADWPTFAHDPQRSGSADEDIFSPQNVGHLELKWATQVDNIPLALNSLTAPVVASGATTKQGDKTVVYVARSSDTFFALDTDDGKILWNRTFNSDVVADSEPFYLCPNAVNATPVIDEERKVVYTIARDGKLYGLDLGTGATKFGPFQFIPALPKPGV